MKHLRLTCVNHPELRWMCKEIAVTLSANGGRGGYNGSRNIFFLGAPSLGKEEWQIEECKCSAADLILATDD